MADFDFEAAVLPPWAYNFHTYMAKGLSKAQAKAAAAKVQAEKVVMSDQYQVNMVPVAAPLPFGNALWLSCKRRDKEAIADRTVLTRILWAVSPGAWAVELFPHEARVVDTANQYHLYAFQQPCFLLDGKEGEKAILEPGVLLSEMLLPMEGDSGPIRLRVLSFTEDAPMRGDWRWLQEKKRTLVGDLEACQLHLPQGEHNALGGALVVLPDPRMRFPFGFSEGLKGSPEEAEKWGAKQRDF